MLQGLITSAWLLALFILGMTTSILGQANVVAQPPDDGPVVLRVGFDASPVGDYTTAAFHSGWPDVEWVHRAGNGSG